MDKSLERREQLVLNAIIREYIRTAHPVGSTVVREKYKLEFSPATIRNDMQELEHKGYLQQPHTSAGRIPTDDGYREFVQQVFLHEQQKQSQLNEARTQQIIEQLRQLQQEYETKARAISHLLANLSGQVGLVVDDEDDRSPSYNGFAQLLKQPEFRDATKALAIAELLDRIDEYDMKKELSKTANRAVNDGTVYVAIGDEIGIADLKECSLVFANFEANNKRGIIALIGPTRMDYETQAKLVRTLTRVFESGLAILCINLILKGTTA